MSLEDLGNIGEFIAAIGVIIFPDLPGSSDPTEHALPEGRCLSTVQATIG
jgi:hypothetical protein